METGDFTNELIIEVKLANGAVFRQDTQTVTIQVKEHIVARFRDESVDRLFALAFSLALANHSSILHLPVATNEVLEDDQEDEDGEDCNTDVERNCLRDGLWL